MTLENYRPTNFVYTPSQDSERKYGQKWTKFNPEKHDSFLEIIDSNWKCIQITNRKEEIFFNFFYKIPGFFWFDDVGQILPIFGHILMPKYGQNLPKNPG